jgi:hypothetical protein
LGWSATIDANIGASVIDGQLASRDTIGVVSPEVGPLKSILAIRDPVRNLEVGALALLGLAGIKPAAVALAGITLPLDN